MHSKTNESLLFQTIASNKGKKQWNQSIFPQKIQLKLTEPDWKFQQKRFKNASSLIKLF